MAQPDLTANGVAGASSQAALSLGNRRDARAVPPLVRLLIRRHVPDDLRLAAQQALVAIRGKDHAAAQCWDDIMQRSRGEKPKGVN